MATGVARQATPSARRCFGQKVAVARGRHPTRAFEVRLVHAACPFGFSRRIKTQHDAGHLTPIGMLGGGIEQAGIGLEVVAVILGEVIGRGRLVRNRR